MLREYAKSWFSAEERRRIRRGINAVKSLYLTPLRRWRTAGIDRRIAYRPEGRDWRSAIPMQLHYSLQQGTIDYRYRDVPMLKHPVEIAHYMRLVWELKPASIIEVGSHAGGTALWLSDLLKTFGIAGGVWSIDISPPTLPMAVDGVTFLRGDAGRLGDTLHPDLLASLPRPWLVIEDASHQYAHTLAVLRFFAPHMRPGEYLIVEDGNVTEMGDDARFDGGPARALAEFLAERPGEFKIDARTCDWYGHNVTGNPNGYLVRC
jgi:cephalosporin hydroxylase